jgi:hypothetical protein
VSYQTFRANATKQHLTNDDYEDLVGKHATLNDQVTINSFAAGHLSTTYESLRSVIAESDSAQISISLTKVWQVGAAADPKVVAS